jgi:ketosteroid isomerase-like protein
MSEKNIEVVRQFLATFIEVDEGLVEPARLKEYCAPEATITLPEPMGAELHVDQFIEFRAGWMEPYDESDYEPEKFLDAGSNRVLVLFHQGGKLRDSDSWIEMHYGIVYTVEEGLITGARMHMSHAEALKAAGLSELAMSEKSPSSGRAALRGCGVTVRNRP